MKINIALENGLLPDRYGKHATGADLYAAHPITSFPFTIEDAPTDAKTFALLLIDFDAVPVSGFPWIHWTAANIAAAQTTLPENASRSGEITLINGRNSNAGHLVNNPDDKIKIGYVGPQPPDKVHDYTLLVFALDTALPLTTGFWFNELRHAMQGHILATATRDIPSRN
ncbi:YbhB/YbcL family Raf kinase inhibitor-like protein [Lacticaseibacillus yichunensis]|uniref:YbhB/YbcL family Raf kinase inhibitor-like protein n=1 Tax=Lacticaseibacillus yichunensis TaxID=2486015 RepID=A0ABW4CQL6_9LACO|nr:YbhB/YbcL family Raf kinase inhibitor-like protein [Lacticaseibacillus yichunensis]